MSERVQTYNISDSASPISTELHFSHFHRMYVQTYREQQQLQQENNQSPGPPAPPPDIEVSTRTSKKSETFRSGIEDHEGSRCLLPCISHGLVPLGSQTGKSAVWNCLWTSRHENCMFQTVNFSGSDIFHSICLLPFCSRQVGRLQGGKSQGWDSSLGAGGRQFLRWTIFRCSQ